MSPARPLLRLATFPLLLALGLAAVSWAGADELPNFADPMFAVSAPTSFQRDLKVEARVVDSPLQALRSGATRLASAPNPQTDVVSTAASWSFESDIANRELGRIATTVGDVNGDGYSDMIASGYGGFNTPLYLFFGSATGPTLAPGYPVLITPFDAFFSAAGDVNGDGRADLFAYWGNGRMRVYFGTATGFALTGFSEIASGLQANVGMVPAPAGDVNADGYDDIMVGQPFAGSAYPCSSPNDGIAWVFYGGATGISLSRSWRLPGSCYGNGMGTSVCGAGDVNADGYDDVVIGTPGLDWGGAGYVQGAVYIIYGSATGLPLANGYADVGTIAGSTRIIGPHIRGGFGRAVCTAGDLNGDGYADVAVGAPYDDTYATDGGFAWVFRGSAAGLDTAQANVLWSETSVTANDQFGGTLMPAGDVNGDGRPDLVVGHNGGSYLAQGVNPTLIIEQTLPTYTSFPWTYWGMPAGDVNGDGISDLVFGQNSYANGQASEGRVLVHYGIALPPSAYANWTLQTSLENPNLGWSVSSAGDVNNDGYDDVLIGAPSWDDFTTPGAVDNGLVLLYLGSATGVPASYAWYAYGNSGDGLGVSVAAAGDINGDGYGDIVAGANMASTGNGNARIWYGGPGGPASFTQNVNLNGYSFGGQFGASVAGAGDVNGDGYADVLVGAPQDETSSGLNGEGRAFLYMGSPFGLSTVPTWTGAGGQAGASYGSCVSAAGDVNGDSYSDFVIGAPNWDYFRHVNQPDVGHFMVYNGRQDGIAQLANAFQNTTLMGVGSALAHAGDVNGDGYSDVIMGAPTSTGSLPNEGYAAVYPGSAAGLSQTVIWSRYGGEAYGDFGSSVSGAGDTNGDGLSDILVGAVFQDAIAGQDAGHGYVFAGPLPNGALPLQTMSGAGAFSNMGHSLANAGDVNNDGWSDLIFGQPGYTTSIWRSGLVGIHYGSRGGALFQATSAIRTTPTTRVIPPLGFTNPGGMLIGATGRSAAGRSRVRMQWQVKPVVGLPVPSQSGIQPATTLTGAPGTYGSLGSLLQSITGLHAGVPYSWRLRALSRSMWYPTGIWRSPARSGALEVDVRAPGTWVDVASGEAPRELTLADARPNPMRTRATVSYALARAGDVSLEVLDLQGRRVKVLARGLEPAGEHQVSWDRRGENGQPVSAGIYFLRLRSEGRALSRKLALIP